MTPRRGARAYYRPVDSSRLRRVFVCTRHRLEKTGIGLTYFTILIADMQDGVRDDVSAQPPEGAAELDARAHVQSACSAGCFFFLQTGCACRY